MPRHRSKSRRVRRSRRSRKTRRMHRMRGGDTCPYCGNPSWTINSRTGKGFCSRRSCSYQED